MRIFKQLPLIILLFTVAVTDTASMKMELTLETSTVVLPLVMETPTPEPIPEPEYAESPYTDNDIELLAKTVWGEARGCTQEEWRLVVWTVLQRVDADTWGDTIETVVTAKWQFIGYQAENPVDPFIYAVVTDELNEWAQGAEPPTHELYAPTAPYYFFNGDGKNNWFRAVW